MRKWRLSQGLSINEVARRAQIAPSTYREWENGRSIKGEPYVKIAQVFGVTLHEVMTGEKGQLLNLYVEINEIEKKCQHIRNILESAE